MFTYQVTGGPQGTLVDPQLSVGRDIRSTLSVIVGALRCLAIFPMFHTPAVCQQYIAKQQKFLGIRSRLRCSYTIFFCFLRSTFCITLIQIVSFHFYGRILHKCHDFHRKPTYLKEQISTCKQQLQSSTISAMS